MAKSKLKSKIGYEEFSDIDKILDNFADELDKNAIILDEELNKCIREARRIDPDCANEIEAEFGKLHTNVRYGSILSTYIKAQVIRPIQKKYLRED